MTFMRRVPLQQNITPQIVFKRKLGQTMEIAFQKLLQDKQKRARFTFSSRQLLALEKLFQEDNFVDIETRRVIAQNLNIPEKAIKVWFQNRRMKEKHKKQTAIINQHYGSIILWWQNSNFNGGPRISVNVGQENIASSMRSEPVPPIEDGVFQVFDMFIKNWRSWRQNDLPESPINVDNYKTEEEEAKEFYKQYRIYMAKQTPMQVNPDLKTATETMPSQSSIGIKTHSFPSVASNKIFQQQDLGQTKPVFRNETVSVSSKLFTSITAYESLSKRSTQPVEHDSNYIIKQEVDQVDPAYKNEIASAAFQLPATIVASTSSAQSPIEMCQEQNSHTVRQKNSELKQVFRNDATSITTGSTIDNETKSSAKFSADLGQHHSNYYLNQEIDTVYRNETALEALELPMDCCSKSSTPISSYIIQQQESFSSPHHTGQVNVLENSRPSLVSESDKNVERYMASGEFSIELFKQFRNHIKRIISNNNASPLNLPTTWTSHWRIPVPSPTEILPYDFSSQSLTKEVAGSSQRLEEECLPLDLSKPGNQRTMPFRLQTPVLNEYSQFSMRRPCHGQRSKSDRIQSVLAEHGHDQQPNHQLLDKQSLVFDNNRHSSDRVSTLVSDDVKSSVIVDKQSYKSHFSKSDHVMPINSKGSRPLASDLDKPCKNNGRFSRSDPNQPTEYDCGRLLICDLPQPVPDLTQPYDSISSQRSTSDCLQPAVITKDDILPQNDNQIYHVRVKNLSGERLWKYRPTEVRVTPVLSEVNNERFSNKISNRKRQYQETVQAKLQPTPQPRSIPNVYIKQEPDAELLPPIHYFNE